MGTHHFEKEPASSHAYIYKILQIAKMSEWMSVVKEIQRAFQAQIVQLVIKHALSWMCIASIMQNKWVSLHEGARGRTYIKLLENNQPRNSTNAHTLLWWYLPNNVRNTGYQHMISKWLWMTGLYMTRDYVTLCISLKKHKQINMGQRDMMHILQHGWHLCRTSGAVSNSSRGPVPKELLEPSRSWSQCQLRRKQNLQRSACNSSPTMESHRQNERDSCKLQRSCLSLYLHKDEQTSYEIWFQSPGPTVYGNLDPSNKCFHRKSKPYS